MMQRASSNTISTESLTTQKKYGSLDNLRLQGTKCIPRLLSIRDPCQEARPIFGDQGLCRLQRIVLVLLEEANRRVEELKTCLEYEFYDSYFLMFPAAEIVSFV